MREGSKIVESKLKEVNKHMARAYGVAYISMYRGTPKVLAPEKRASALPPLEHRSILQAEWLCCLELSRRNC